MKKNVHMMLLRPWRCLFYTWVLAFPLGVLPTSLGVRLSAFLGWGLLLPWALGMTLSAMLHEPMHRPFSMLLPTGRRRLLRSHATVVGCIAVACGTFGFITDRSLPPLALVGLATVTASFSLPFEPGLRWAGSRWGGVAAIAALLAFVWQGGTLRTVFISHPWLSAAGMFAVATLQFAAAFSRVRLRIRATMPFTPLLTIYEGPNFAELRRKEDLARGTASRVTWRPTTARDSLITWIKAVRYERSAGWRGGNVPALLCFVGALTAYYALTHKQGSFVQSIYSTIVTPAVATRSPQLMFFVATIVWARQYLGPRSDRLYPISRARRAHVAYAASASQAVLSYGLIVGSMLLMGWGAALKLGQPFGLSEIAPFLMKFGITLPLIPLLQWCMLYAEVRGDRAVQILSVMLAMLPVVAWQFGASQATAYLNTPAGALIFLLIIAGTQWAYYAALRRFYRSGDLLQTGTTRRNFSLV